MSPLDDPNSSVYPYVHGKRAPLLYLCVILLPGLVFRIGIVVGMHALCSDPWFAWAFALYALYKTLHITLHAGLDHVLSRYWPKRPELPPPANYTEFFLTGQATHPQPDPYSEWLRSGGPWNPERPGST